MEMAEYSGGVSAGGVTFNVGTGWETGRAEIGQKAVSEVGGGGGGEVRGGGGVWSDVKCVCGTEHSLGA